MISTANTGITNSVSASVTVPVGSTSAPLGKDGLAHFCEHMLFMGTGKYKEEDGFNKFLAKRGGSSNAFTESESTTYYFNQQLGKRGLNMGGDWEGLDRFLDFFSSPLFSLSSVSREVNAVDSEHSKNLQSDVFRVYEIEKRRATGGHPYSRFWTGDKTTLLPKDNQEGREELRNALVDLFDDNYRKSAQTAVVISPRSIDEMESSVFKSLSATVSTKPRAPTDKDPSVLPNRPAPFSSDPTKSEIPGFGYVVKIVPVQELRQVTMVFPIPYKDGMEKEEFRRSRPQEYLGHLLGHEGKGSLLSYLKGKGWANGVGASTNVEMEDFETFEVVVDLTEEGLREWRKVVGGVMGYVDLLKGKWPTYIEDEVLRMAELSWEFFEVSDPTSFASTISQNMDKYRFDKSLAIAGGLRLAAGGAGKEIRETMSDNDREDARKGVKGVLQRMTIDNCLVTILSKEFEREAKEKERVYGTKYAVEKLGNIEILGKSEMSFPEKNVFIPTREGMRIKNRQKGQEKDRMAAPRPPVKVRDDDKYEVWFKGDDRFGKPKEVGIFSLLTNAAYGGENPDKKAAIASLYELAIEEYLNEYCYPARLAGLSYSLEVLPRGLRLTVGGYNEKIPELAKTVCECLKDRSFLPDEKTFARFKDQVVRVAKAFDNKQPYGLASYYAGVVAEPRRFKRLNGGIRKELDKVTLKDLEEYSKTIWKEGKMKALIQGNVEQKEAEELVNLVGGVLDFETGQVPEEYYPLLIPKEGLKLGVRNPNPNNLNDAVEVVIQSRDTSERGHAVVEVLAAIASEPFYDDLRTKQQLGYVVTSGVNANGETRSVVFLVQSGTKGAEGLSKAVSKFLEEFEGLLGGLSNEDVSEYVKGLLEKKLEPDKRLIYEVKRNWGEIASDKLVFDRTQREAKEMETVGKDDVLRWWKEAIAEGGMVEVRVRSKGGAEGRELGVDEIDKNREGRERGLG